MSVNYFNTVGSNITGMGTRELLVLRHKKGTKVLHVYSANINSNTIGYKALENMKPNTYNVSAPLIFGCSKNLSNSYNPYQDFTTGTIFWSKLWLADLGDTECRKIAGWTHETMDFSVAKFSSYYNGDGSGSDVMFTFLADHLLPKNKPLGSAKYPESNMNKYLNDRVFSAFPVQWKGLMQQTQLPCWDGVIQQKTASGLSYEWVPSPNTTVINPFIFIPNIYEVDLQTGASNSYYPKECGEGNHLKSIPYLTGAALTCYYIDRPNIPGYYFTRSFAPDNADHIYSVIWSDGRDGVVSQINAYTAPTENYAIRIMFSI